MLRVRENTKIQAGGEYLSNRDTIRITGFRNDGKGRIATAERLLGPGRWSAPFDVPAAYLRQSAELDYAGNVYVSQGRTVDTGRPSDDGGDATGSLLRRRNPWPRAEPALCGDRTARPGNDEPSGAGGVDEGPDRRGDGPPRGRRHSGRTSRQPGAARAAGRAAAGPVEAGCRPGPAQGRSSRYRSRGDEGRTGPRHPGLPTFSS